MRSAFFLTGFYCRSATPGCRRRPWGDLVVPTEWRQWGRSMDFLSFCFPTFRSKGWREIVHHAVRKGQLNTLPQDLRWGNPRRATDSNYRPCTIHTRSDQPPILPPLSFLQPIFVSVESFSGMFRSSFPLLRKSEPLHVHSSEITVLNISIRTPLIYSGPSWIDLIELICWHKFCETVWENLLKKLMTIFTSFFRLIFISSPIYISYKNSL